jgi:hypothetical protein
MPQSLLKHRSDARFEMVKLRRTHYEHTSSALPSDIARCSRHFAFVPCNGDLIEALAVFATACGHQTRKLRTSSWKIGALGSWRQQDMVFAWTRG